MKNRIIEWCLYYSDEHLALVALRWKEENCVYADNAIWIKMSKEDA